MMQTKFAKFGVGLLGLAGSTTLAEITPPDPHTLENIFSLLGQIAIAIATVWQLFKKKPSANDVANK